MRSTILSMAILSDSQQTGRRDDRLVPQQHSTEGEVTMSFTVPELLETLEAQMARHREREAFHAAQEAAHREERARHAAELERLTKHYESLRESVGAIEGIAAARKPRSLERGGRTSLTRLVAQAVEDLEPEQHFTASEVAAEVDRRFGSRLRKPAERGRVGMALRRMHERGLVRLVRKGRSHTETVYARAIRVK